jgi:hypothetical protein
MPLGFLFFKNISFLRPPPEEACHAIAKAGLLNYVYIYKRYEKDCDVFQNMNIALQVGICKIMAAPMLLE